MLPKERDIYHPKYWPDSLVDDHDIFAFFHLFRFVLQVQIMIEE